MDRVDQRWIGINDQPDLVALIDIVQDRVVDPLWAIDVTARSASSVIALWLESGQRVVYLPGDRGQSGLSRLPRGRETHAKDAAIIADRARMRRHRCELHVLNDDIAQLLSSYRADLAVDRSGGINRLRGLVAGIFPALNECWASQTAAR
jgi:hypothetical protein